MAAAQIRCPSPWRDFSTVLNIPLAVAVQPLPASCEDEPYPSWAQDTYLLFCIHLRNLKERKQHHIFETEVEKLSGMYSY